MDRRVRNLIFICSAVYIAAYTRNRAFIGILEPDPSIPFGVVFRQRRIIPHPVVKIETGFLKRPHRRGIITRPGTEISGTRVVFEGPDEFQREIFGIFQIENNGSGFKA